MSKCSTNTYNTDIRKKQRESNPIRIVSLLDAFYLNASGKAIEREWWNLSDDEMSTAARANAAMMGGKLLSSYDLPKSVKEKILSRHYSQKEINERFKRYLSSKNQGK